VPALRAGRRATALISLHGIRGLEGVQRNGSTLEIGAGVTYAGLLADAAIRAALPDLAAAFAQVANVRVRHVATLGGNVMAHNPLYDVVPALLALEASLIFVDRKGRRHRIGPAGPTMPDGVLEAVAIPLAAERRFVFERGYKPVLSLAVAVELRNGRRAGRAAVGCAHERPVALALDLGRPTARAALAGSAGEVAQDFAARLPAPPSDTVASGEYRRSLARVLLERALRALSAD
jgi:CO/xanthine dehydrogenase FAD-binding subunit